MKLPFRRRYNDAFKGRGDVVLIDMFPVMDGEHVTFVFEEARSPWRQGAWLACNRGVEINNQVLKSVVLWQDTSPAEIDTRCLATNGLMAVYNVWDRGQGRDSLSYSSGMLIEELPTGRRHRCSDIGFETDFRKLIFRIDHQAK